MTPRRILILSDGRPGHFNLAEGVAAALERLGPGSTARLQVQRGRWPGAVVAALTRAHLPPAPMLTRVYGLVPADIPPADIVVSAGAETLAANIWVARSQQIPNLFYGSLRLFRPQDFALVLTSYARNAVRPRHAVALKPSRLDPDSIRRSAQASFGQDNGSGHRPSTAALLIGGNAGGITYGANDWTGLLAFMEMAARQASVRWIVSNSRRTPSDVSARLTAIATRTGGPIARFIDVREPGAPSLAEVFRDADAVVCTDDSSSMISEAIWARRPVLGVRPAICRHTSSEQAYRAWLEGNGWAATLPISQLTVATWLQAIDRLTPLAGNPLADLATLLADRLQLKPTT